MEEDPLNKLWDISHGVTPGDPTKAFLDYCHIVLDAYRNQEVDSEHAAYDLCGVFTPETKFTQTSELEELHDLVCDLELGEMSVHIPPEPAWKRVEVLLQQYEKRVQQP